MLQQPEGEVEQVMHVDGCKRGRFGRGRGVATGGNRDGLETSIDGYVLPRSPTEFSRLVGV